MTLQFVGTQGVGAVSYRYWTTSPGAGVALTEDTVFGGFFTPQVTFLLQSITHPENPANLSYTHPLVPITIPLTAHITIWNEDGEAIAHSSSSSFSLLTSTKQNVKPVRLDAGKVYTIALAYPKHATVASTGGADVQLDPYITWGNAAESLGNSGDIPDDVGNADWKVNVALGGVVYEPVNQTVPPDPLVAPGPQMFGIAFQRSWMPNSVQEWTLQYQKSPDGSNNWTEWRTLGTFPVIENVFMHTGLDPFDHPYYAYRYKVASASEQSPWSEVRFAGYVVNGVVTDIDGALDLEALVPTVSLNATQLNIEALSTITANVGLLTAGIVRGPLIETSAENPRIYMQQGVGLQATDGSGGNVFSLDATTGALTLKGAIQSGSTITGTTLTGGTVQTGTSGARVVMNSSGLTAYHTDGTTKKLEFKISDGSLAITGSLTGSTITGGTIQTATSGSRIVMTSAGLVGYDTDGTTEKFNLDTATGALTLTGPAIEVATITGGLIQTATSGARLVLDTSYLRAYDSTATEVLRLSGAGLTFINVEDSAGSAGGQQVTWSGIATQTAQSTDDGFGNDLNSLEVRVNASGSGDTSTLYLRADAGPSLDLAYLKVDAPAGGSPSLIMLCNTTLGGGTGELTLMDMSGSSRFLQDAGSGGFGFARKLVLHGPYTAAGGSIATGAESNIGVTVDATSSSDWVVWGHLYDGTWSAQCSWRADRASSTSMHIRFLNLGSNTATPNLKFYILDSQ